MSQSYFKVSFATYSFWPFKWADQSHRRAQRLENTIVYGNENKSWQAFTAIRPVRQPYKLFSFSTKFRTYYFIYFYQRVSFNEADVSVYIQQIITYLEYLKLEFIRHFYVLKSYYFFQSKQFFLILKSRWQYLVKTFMIKICCRWQFNTRNKMNPFIKPLIPSVL